VLGREGRMTSAIEMIGQAQPATEAEPFRLGLE
jgi:hypothetical protein